MTYRERQRQTAIQLRQDFFKDPGNGRFLGKEREFVLRNPVLNIWEGVRKDAIDYFESNSIQWWPGRKVPSGHLLSSQIACVNHLFFLRSRQELATCLLQSIEPQVDCAEKVDNSYIEFEFIGKKKYLHEKSFTRGANCTSVDAAMIGRMQDNTKCLFLIEWKYTESYQKISKYIKKRADVYDGLIKKPGSPFHQKEDTEVYYYEPFYQLMRQTLLGWLLTENNDHDCSQYRHIHVVPKENEEFGRNITSRRLSPGSKDVTEAWRSVLVSPDFYVTTTPKDFLMPVVGKRDTAPMIEYLQKRYWGE